MVDVKSKDWSHVEWFTFEEIENLINNEENTDNQNIYKIIKYWESGKSYLLLLENFRLLPFDILPRKPWRK